MGFRAVTDWRENRGRAVKQIGNRTMGVNLSDFQKNVKNKDSQTLFRPCSEISENFSSAGTLARRFCVVAGALRRTGRRGDW